MRWKGGSVGCIKRTGARPMRQVYQFSQLCRECCTRHRARKADQRELGGSGLAAEHRFAVEHPADRHAVEAADQLAVTPGFHRMRIAGIEQAAIGRNHRRRDPGAAGLFAGFGARSHHVRKRGVDAHLETAISDAFGEGAGYADLVRHQYHARVGTPPQDRLTGVEPGEDAVTIGIQQAIYRQIAAHRQQAIGLTQRGLDRREMCGVLETFAHDAMVADSFLACVRIFSYLRYVCLIYIFVFLRGVANMKKSLLVLALVAALPTSALAENWMMRVRAIDIVPDVKSSGLAGLDVSNEVVPEVDYTYFVTPNIGMELILGTARHEVTLNGASLGKLNHLPPTLTVQYHFNPTPTIKPYVGAGVNYTRFYNVDLAPGLSVGKNSFGGALQAGVDIAVTKNGYINLDVKKIWIDTDVKAGGVKLTNLEINPVVWGIGYGFRF